MTNFNQFQNENTVQYQPVFQRGFAGTNAQQVRQQNAQSIQSQFAGSRFQPAGQQQFGFQQQAGYGASQFGAPQSVFQPGFAGTDAQQVRQQNAQSIQSQFAGSRFQPAGQQQFGFQQQAGYGASQFGAPQSVFQPGFAGTDAQQVRQQNAQSIQSQFAGSRFQPAGQQQFGFQQQVGYGASQFGAPQSVFQPGFAGTDAQQVRQQNAQSIQSQFTGNRFQPAGQQQFGFQQPSSFSSQFGSTQSVFQPGFAGTNAQHVRQQNAQSVQGQQFASDFIQ